MKNKKLLVIGAIILALVVGFLLGNIETDTHKDDVVVDMTPIETIPTDPIEEDTTPTEGTEPSEEVTEPTIEETVPPTTEPVEDETTPTEPEKEEEKEEVKPKPVVTFKSCEKTMYVVSKTLNARRGPGTDYEKIGTFAQWEYVRVIGIGSNNWYMILFNDDIAYVAGNYLADIEIEETEPSEPIEDTTPPVTESETIE